MITSCPPPWFPCSPFRRGFSLIELLIASVIGGLILASVSALVVSQIRASATQVQIQTIAQ
jgi:prepilin-type N-terminal cleavage/methylation domain-containing protein